MALIPVYNSKGDAEAFLEYPHLFNRNGEWVGFVTQKREVYSVLGYYVGYSHQRPAHPSQTRNSDATVAGGTRKHTSRSAADIPSGGGAACPAHERDEQQPDRRAA